MTKPLCHIVPNGTPSERLDRYLTAVLPDHSRSQIQQLIAKGHIRAGEPGLKSSHRVTPGEVILIQIPPQAVQVLKAESIPLSILYEDSYLLLLDKPAGLVVHPAPGHPSGTLVNALLGRRINLSSVAGPSKPGIVHRLDKDTSGILVVAKDNQSHRNLSRQFATGQVRRTYRAVVRGVVQQEEGTVEAPIGRHPLNRQRMSVRYGSGREAVTRYHVLERYPCATLLELFPQTGRTHQLRVHLAHLGYPLLGDTRYGVRGGFPRQALHAYCLGFQHPQDGRWVEFTCPLPLDVIRGIEQLKGRNP